MCCVRESECETEREREREREKKLLLSLLEEAGGFNDLRLETGPEAKPGKREEESSITDTVSSSK